MSPTHPITNKRGKVVHLSALGFKPLCKPGTRIVFHPTLIGRDHRLCEACADIDVQMRHENEER